MGCVAFVPLMFPFIAWWPGRSRPAGPPPTLDPLPVEPPTAPEAHWDRLPLDEPTRPALVVVNRYPPAEVARALGTAFVMVGGLYVLWRVHEVVILMFLAILLATAIAPAVNVLRRGPFSRGSGVLVVYTAIILTLGIPLYLVIPGLLEQLGTFADSLPGRLESLRTYASDLGPRPLQEAVVNGLDRLTASVQQPVAPAETQIVEAGATVGYTLINFVTVFVLAFYWIVERASVKRALLRAVTPRHARDVQSIWMEVEQKLGGWVRGQLLLMGTIGIAAGLGYAVIGLPNPAVLGLAAALLEFVPMIGPFLAFAPAVLVALAIDPTLALKVIAYAFVIQQIESNVLVPRVMGHTVGISPLTVLLGILVGSVLYGLPGAFLAVPIAGALQVILAHLLRVEGAAQAEAHPLSTLSPAPGPSSPSGRGSSGGMDPRSSA